MIYLRLFYEFFKAGLFAVGGGLATLPFLQDISDSTGWFTHGQLADMVAVSESTPGPIGVNMATYCGMTTAGIPGALAAVFGVILPPFIMMILVTFFYTFISTNPYVRLFIGGMQMGVCAMLLDVVLGLFNGVRKMNNIFYYIMVVLCFLVVCLSKLSVFYLALLCIAVAIVKTLMIKIKVEHRNLYH
mgnify:CR=1 FL=1